MSERRVGLPRASPDELIFVGSSRDRRLPLFSILPLREGLIGRAPTCELQFDDPFMAPEHGQLAKLDGQWFLAAARMGLAIFVEGVRPAPGEGFRLEPGMHVEVADTWFVVGGGSERPVIPLDDAVARAALGDRLEELDDPLADYVNMPRSAWPTELAAFGDRVDDVAFDGALVRRATIRADEATDGLGLRRKLREFLAHPFCTAIESLTVATETLSGDAFENARLMLHAVAATCPPRLCELNLGVVAIDAERLAPELEALSRVLPLRTTVSTLLRRPGAPSIVVLDVAGEVPAVPERIPLVDGLRLTRDRWFAGEEDEGSPAQIVFHDRGDGRWSAESRERRHLRTGDELALRDLNFRFEI